MKTGIVTGVAALIIFAAISCKKENINIPSSTATQSSNNAVTGTTAHYIDEISGGGVVFWMMLLEHMA